MLTKVKRQKEGKEFFDEKVFISKNCWNKYLANLLPAKPAKRFSKSC